MIAPYLYCLRHTMGLAERLRDWIRWILLQVAWLLSDLFGWRFAARFCPTVMKGKVAIVTGANIGLGPETTKALLQQGAIVIMACRNMHHAHTSRDYILRDWRNHGPVGEAHQRLIPLHLDLEDFNSIKQFVSDFHALNLPLHLLVNNAGIHLKPFKRVSLDFERTMAVDYFGPFWLTQMLLPDLKANAPSRIVNVASIGEAWGAIVGYTSSIPYDDIPGYRLEDSGERPYTLAKTMLLMANTRELARRLEGSGVDIIAVHPGFADSTWYLKTDIHNYFLSWIIYHTHCILGDWVKVGQHCSTGAISQIYSSIEPSLTGSTSKPGSRGLLDSYMRDWFGGRLIYRGPWYMGVFFLQNWNNTGNTWAWNPWVYNKQACARLYNASVELVQLVEERLPVQPGQTLPRDLVIGVAKYTPIDELTAAAKVPVPQGDVRPASKPEPFENNSGKAAIGKPEPVVKAEGRYAGIAQPPLGAEELVH